jgi:short-subunit dehydrogenase
MTRTRARFVERYGPWAVVTGASSGLGRSIARELAARGLYLVLVARRRERLEEMARELAEQHGTESVVLPLDLAATSGADELDAATAELDVGLLVAAAGFGGSGAFLDGGRSRELEMIDVNVKAAVAQAHTFGRRFAERGRGGIVLFGSIVGFQGAPWAAGYAATKAYMQVLAEGLARELGRRGVDVLSAAPGPVATGFAERAGMTMGKALSPDDLAAPILDALGARTTVLPGGLSKLLRWSLAPLPRGMRVRIMGRVMGGMANAPTP